MKMTRIILIVMLVAASIEAYSNPVDAETAKRVAQNFMGKSRNDSRSVSDVVVEKWEEQTSIYVVNFREGGWVMVSADDTAVPVLAFSDNGAYRAEDEKPDGFLFLVSEYMEQIGMARKTKPVRSSEVVEMWNSLTANDGRTDGTISQKSHALANAGTYMPGSILLDVPGRGRVVWGQDYNNDPGYNCNPSYNSEIKKKWNHGWFSDCDCDRPPVGCGAVALGQLMWYWKWPQSSTYRTYDWNLMPNALRNSTPAAEAKEVALLLKDCGEASGMTYACLGSFTTKLDSALTHTFGYSAARKVRKSEWTHSAWNRLIRTEIDCERPVIYYGEKAWTMDKRHYFIVDGYHAYIPNYFHINFGWRGSYNYEHFYLGDITPGSNNYNSNQYAIIGISPTYSYPYRENVTNLTYIESLMLAALGGLTVEARQNISLPAPGKSLIVENGAFLTLIAGNSITMNPGFEVRPGGKFTTRIDPAYADMEISVSEWPAEAVVVNTPFTFTLRPVNANSFDFTVKDASGNTVYQNANIVYHSIDLVDFATLWNGLRPSPGVYTCTVRLRNNYGRELEHTWNVTVKSSSSKSAMAVDSVNIDRPDVSASDISDTENTAIAESDVVVYPNPNSGTVYVSIAKPFSAYSLKVYNVSGVLVWQVPKITEPEYSFDMSRFADGTYLLQMEIDRKPVSKKIILAR